MVAFRQKAESFIIFFHLPRLFAKLSFSLHIALHVVSIIICELRKEKIISSVVTQDHLYIYAYLAQMRNYARIVIKSPSEWNSIVLFFLYINVMMEIWRIQQSGDFAHSNWRNNLRKMFSLFVTLNRFLLLLIEITFAYLEVRREIWLLRGNVTAQHVMLQRFSKYVGFCQITNSKNSDCCGAFDINLLVFLNKFLKNLNKFGKPQMLFD